MFRKKTVLGLDIGNLAIKLVELTIDSEGIALTNYGVISFPPEADETKKNALIITEIRKMLGSKKIRTKEVVFSLKGRDVIMNFFRLPLMPEKELKEVIRQEALRISHLPEEETNWDYLLFPEEEKEEIRAIIILSKKIIISQLTSLIQQIPLKAISITVRPLALWETISKLEYKKEETVLCFHIDEEITTIMLIRERNLLFTRKVYLATASFLEDVSTKLDLGREEIERLKGELKRGIMSTDVKEVITPWLERLAIEVDRSLEYHRNQLKEAETARIDRIVLSGPGSQWKGVKDFFAERLEVKTEVFDLFHVLKVEPGLFDMRQLREAAPLLTIAAGLSLSQLSSTMASLQPKRRVKKSINLLFRKRRKLLSASKFLFRAGVPSLGLFLLFLLFFTTTTRLRCREDVEMKIDVLDELEEIIAAAKKEGIAKESSFIRKAFREQVKWSEILKELNRITPGPVWITGLSYEKEKLSERLKIEGCSSSNSSIVEFVSRLQTSSLFSDICLKEFQKDSFNGEEIAKFVLTSELRKEL